MIRAKSSEDMRYAYTVGMVRAKESKLLTSSQYERLVQSSSQDELIRMLSDTPYGNIQADDFEEILKTAWLENRLFLEKFCLDEWVVDLFRIREDFYNLKVIIKSDFAETDPTSYLSPFGIFESGSVKEILEQNGKKFPDALKNGYVDAIEQYAQNKDSSYIDIEIDKAAMQYYLEQSEESDFLTKYFKLSIDLSNIGIFSRIKFFEESSSLLNTAIMDNGFVDRKLYLDLFSESWNLVPPRFGLSFYHSIVEQGIQFLLQNKSFSLLETLIDTHRLEYLKRSRYFTFGFEPLVSYFLFRETEIRNLRRISIGVANRLEPERIKEGLLYVS